MSNVSIPDVAGNDDETIEPGKEILAVRIPADLKKRFADMAARNHRSITGELVRLIEIAVSQPFQSPT